MGIKQPIVTEIAKNTYAINEFGLTAMYLLVGDTSALLIDTGCGACDLAGIVASLTDKPYKVWLTHGHLDHAGGIGAFDEIWLGQEDFEMARSITVEALADYLDQLGRQGGYEAFDYSSDVLKPMEHMPKMNILIEGMKLDLGNRVVEVIEVPGHTMGGLCFLDDTTKILFSGDACNTNLLVMGGSVNQTLAGLYHLKSYESRWERMYNGHIGYAGSPYILSQPESTLDDCIRICESILNKSAEPKKFRFLNRDSYAVEYGVSRIVYDPNRLMDAYEVPAGYSLKPDQIHGRLDTITYQTRAYEDDDRVLAKKAHVYVPAGYDSKKKYPILYLLHGGGETEDYWMIKYPETLWMVDRLITEGKVEPLLIVTPTLYPRDKQVGFAESRPLPYRFHHELRNDLIPAVERAYSTYACGDVSEEKLQATRSQRAFAGLSMGSMTTYESAFLKCLDLFAWFGPYSGCAGPNGDTEAAAERYASMLKELGEKYPVSYMLCCNGTTDIAHDEHVNTMKALLAKTDCLKEGENYAFVDLAGEPHTYRAWKKDLYLSLLTFFH